jgi:hypothetical protein
MLNGSMSALTIQTTPHMHSARRAPREHPKNDAGLDVSPAVRTYLVYRLLNPLSFVAIKMGRRQGARRAHI